MADLTPFTRDIETRGYETDFTGTLPVVTYLQFFEYQRWEFMRDPRLGIEGDVHGGSFFVIRRQTCEILRHIGQGTPLRLAASFIQVGRATASVYQEAVRISDGAPVARARVMGVWIAPNRRPARLPDGFRAFARAQIAAGVGPTPHDPTVLRPPGGAATSLFDPPEVVRPGLGLDIEAPEEAPPDDAFCNTLTVPPRDIDIFSHVNAATWLRYCDDARHFAADAGALPASAGAGSRCVRASIVYLNEAVVGQALSLAAWQLDAATEAGITVGVHVLSPGSPDALIRARMDLAPGARPISPTRA